MRVDSLGDAAARRKKIDTLDHRCARAVTRPASRRRSSAWSRPRCARPSRSSGAPHAHGRKGVRQCEQQERARSDTRTFDDT